ncbi:hypothetical protein CsatB_004815 [Cannabis sativa]
MDTAHWPQEIVVKPIEEIITNSCPKPHTNNIQASSSLSQGGKINNNNNNNNIINNNNNTNLVDMRSSSISKTSMMKPSSQNKDHHQQALNCPRCNSTNTKFCYYNNYSLTQPRYFCKTCRRYWTEGGSLRSIPVGGGSRKNKRSSPSSSSSSSKIIINSRLPDLVHNQLGQAHQAHQAQAHDLNLGFYPPIINDQKINHIISNPSSNTSPTSTTTTTTTTTTNTSDHFSALELLTGLTSRGFNSFFPIPDFKPSLNFSLDGLGPNTTSATTTTTNTASAYGSLPSVHENNNSGSGRLLFPFEDLKQVSSQNNNNNNSGIIDQNNNIIKENGDSTGYWTGMLGGGW